ncbi:MAG: FecR domain-containing protein [Pseudomonadota bacterium]
MMEPDDRFAPATTLEHEAYAWVVRFVSGAASPADVAALKAWSTLSPAHAAAFDRASKVWQAVEPVAKKLAELNPPAAPGNTPARGARLGRRAFLGGALAASVVGTAELVIHPPLGLWPSWSELTADYRTKPGEQRQISLPDHIAIDMNTRTSIALRTAKSSAHRIELISGEAIISAPLASSDTFTVLAADGRITASNARFDLRSDGQSACVTGIAGKIMIACGLTSMSLLAGQQVTYSARRFGEIVTVDPDKIIAWQSGVIIFDATPVSEVVEEINRYRPGRVILTNAALGRERFSARFRLADIDGLADKIARVFGARTTILPAGIVLLG